MDIPHPEEDDALLALDPLEQDKERGHTRYHVPLDFAFPGVAALAPVEQELALT